MNRAVPQGRPQQSPQRSASVPPSMSQTATPMSNSMGPVKSSPLSNSIPSFPKGQMPIEEVFKMMWGRMNFLENAVNEKGIPIEGDQTTIANLRSNTIIPDSIQKQLDDNTAKINTLAQEVGSLKKTLITTVTNFNQSMQAVGADLTEMNNKYTQMNNFLMEIQTTQITVNNKILKHYNDNYSDILESHIEKRANEKFIASAEVASTGVVETVSVGVETSEVVEDTAVVVEDTAIVDVETSVVVEDTAEVVEHTDEVVEYTAAPPYESVETTVDETIARGEAAEQAQAEQAQAKQAQAKQVHADQVQAEKPQADQAQTNNVTFNIE
ncbi:MAG: hypothetical protein ACR2M6_00445 [Vampirovibrionia bacterium]